MVCPTCHTGSLVSIPAEIRLYRNSPRTLSHPPMTPSLVVRVCVDCGWVEFTVPQSWLSAGWLGLKRSKNITSVSETKSSKIFAA